MEGSSTEIGTMFDMLTNVSPHRESWRFKIRLIRLWTIYSKIKAGHLDSFEMIFIDEEGTKIRASIFHKLLYLFRHQLFEGNVYMMSNFRVEVEVGVNRTTTHPYHLHFIYKTKVEKGENCSIVQLGLTLTSIANVREFGADHEFLVDVVGLVLRTSSERECTRDGKRTKEIVLHMFDNSGNCECVLIGAYVDEFQNLVDRSGGGIPVIVIQFAKIRSEEGKISIETFSNVSRILLDPFVPEMIAFKESLAIVGVVSIGPHTRPSIDEDFMTRNPPISISNLYKTNKEGFYIVGGIVHSLVDPEDWWYPGCFCHAILSHNANGFFCNDCAKEVTNMIPRFKVKLKVEDGTGQGIFVVSDQEMVDLLGKHCHEILTVHEGDISEFYPSELESLKGRKLLLKVEKSNSDHDNFPDKPFKVERLCADLSLIDAYDSPFLNEATDSEDDE